MKAWEIWTGPVFGPHPVLLISAQKLEKKDITQKRGEVRSYERWRDISRKIIQGLALAGL